LRSFAPICGEVRFSGDIELYNSVTSAQKGNQKPTKSYFFDGYNHLQVTSTSKGDLKPT